MNEESKSVATGLLMVPMVAGTVAPAGRAQYNLSGGTEAAKGNYEDGVGMLTR